MWFWILKDGTIVSCCIRPFLYENLIQCLQVWDLSLANLSSTIKLPFLCQRTHFIFQGFYMWGCFCVVAGIILPFCLASFPSPISCRNGWFLYCNRGYNDVSNVHVPVGIFDCLLIYGDKFCLLYKESFIKFSELLFQFSMNSLISQ